MRRGLPAGAGSIDRLVSKQPWDLLLPHLMRVGVEPGPAITRLKQFASGLLNWNAGISNLISSSDSARIVERHILESIEPAHWLASSKAQSWMDLGSGGGFPAIPLAILGVGERWTLVESRRNKTLFLRRIVGELGLKQVQIVTERIENLPLPEPADRFDGFTSRATMTLAPTLEQAARFVRPGGTAFLWKGSRRESEVTADHAWESDWELDGLLGIGAGLTTVSRFKRKTI